MQRSSELIACILFRSILDSSNRHHGVNRTYLLSRGLFHPFVAETLELVLAEVQLLHDASKLMMMLSLLSQRLASVLLSICLLLVHCARIELQEVPVYRQLQSSGLQTCGCPTLAVDHHVV